jgi:hypothetical protein
VNTFDQFDDFGEQQGFGLDKAINSILGHKACSPMARLAKAHTKIIKSCIMRRITD